MKPSYAVTEIWITVVDSDGVKLRVRVQEQDGRLVIVALHLHAPEITNDLWRDISVSRIDATINTHLAVRR